MLTKLLLLVLVFYCPQAIAEVFLQNPELEYHIQTDQGPDRFFRFQTQTGQYRKEQRHPDGSVTGTYGWVDPNGVLRLFDYISDNLGYRIERERLFKVGQRVAGGKLIRTNAGEDLNIGFEVFPLDLGSDPAFNGLAKSTGSVPLGGSGGFRALHVGDGDFGLTPSYQVGSLTTTYDHANPLSKQEQATFYEADPILVKALPPPKPKVVIGARHNKLPPVPKPKTKFVIGKTANDVPVHAKQSPRTKSIVIGVTNNHNDRTSSRSRSYAAPSSRSEGNSRRGGIVIGRTARNLF